MQATIANTVTQAEFDHLSRIADSVANRLIARDQEDQIIISDLQNLGNLTNRGWQDTVDAIRGMLDDQSDNGSITADQAEIAENFINELITQVDRMTGWPELHG
jgi:hypothetical protein